MWKLHFLLKKNQKSNFDLINDLVADWKLLPDACTQNFMERQRSGSCDRSTAMPMGLLWDVQLLHMGVISGHYSHFGWMFESALRFGKQIRLTFTWRKIIHAYNLHTSLRHSGLNASADPGLSLNGQFECVCVCVLKDVESFYFLVRWPIIVKVRLRGMIWTRTLDSGDGT